MLEYRKGFHTLFSSVPGDRRGTVQPFAELAFGFLRMGRCWPNGPFDSVFSPKIFSLYSQF